MVEEEERERHRMLGHRTVKCLLVLINDGPFKNICRIHETAQCVIESVL